MSLVTCEWRVSHVCVNLGICQTVRTRDTLPQDLQNSTHVTLSSNKTPTTDPHASSYSVLHIHVCTSTPNYVKNLLNNHSTLSLNNKKGATRKNEPSIPKIQRSESWPSTSSPVSEYQNLGNNQPTLPIHLIQFQLHCSRHWLGNQSKREQSPIPTQCYAMWYPGKINTSHRMLLLSFVIIFHSCYKRVATKDHSIPENKHITSQLLLSFVIILQSCYKRSASQKTNTSHHSCYYLL
jgi:hypothetical protein